MAEHDRSAARTMPPPGWWWRALVAWLLACAAGLAIGELTRRGGDWSAGLAWERRAMLAIHEVTIPQWLDALVVAIPWAGTNYTLLPVVALGVAILAWRRRVDLALHVATVQLGSLVLNVLVKGLYDRARPALWEKRGQFGLASYPSGHVIATISVLFTIALLLRAERGWRWPLWLAAVMLVVGLWSRVYLGVHWPTDLLGGAAMGTIWLVGAWQAFRRPATYRLREADVRSSAASRA